MTPQSSDFQELLTKEARFSPTPEQLVSLNVKDYQTLYDKVAGDLEGFWDEVARDFTWEKPWTKVLEGSAPDARWFIDGQVNITTNCLDRHANGSRADKTALLWVGEDGEERSYTFSELLAFTCRLHQKVSPPC